MRAYDIETLTRNADLADPDCHGWCFGLPPGIEPQQWPLNPANGYPLCHGFTLLLPEDYRCHGPDVVALSFFASANEHNDGGPVEKTGVIRAALLAAADEGHDDDDPDLVPFWQSRRNGHSCLHRLEDTLGIAFAAILLTSAELNGPFCRPPTLTGNRYLDLMPPPRWMSVGVGAAFWNEQSSVRTVRDTFGGQPTADLADNRALRWTPRACDLNAGKAPRDRAEG